MHAISVHTGLPLTVRVSPRSCVRAQCTPVAVFVVEQNEKGQRSRAKGLRVRQATTADVPEVARLCTEVR